MINLTEKENKVLKYLVAEGLECMGGKQPTDLIEENMSWFGIKDIMSLGFNRHQAAGLMSSLNEKEMVMDTEGGVPDLDGRVTWIVTEDGINIIQNLKEM